MVHSIIIVGFTILFNTIMKWSDGIGKILGFLNIFAVTVIEPGFYFIGDVRFRRSYHLHGFLFALKEALLTTNSR